MYLKAFLDTFPAPIKPTSTTLNSKQPSNFTDFAAQYKPTEDLMEDTDIGNWLLLSFLPPRQSSGASTIKWVQSKINSPVEGFQGVDPKELYRALEKIAALTNGDTLDVNTKPLAAVDEVKLIDNLKGALLYASMDLFAHML